MIAADDPNSRLMNLPLEVRGADFALIKRTTMASLPGAIEAGTVADKSGYISVTLPNGSTVGKEFDFTEGCPTDPDWISSELQKLPSVSDFLKTSAVVTAARAIEAGKAAIREMGYLQDAAPPSTDTDALPPHRANATRFDGTGALADASTGRALGFADTVIRLESSAQALPATVQLSYGDDMPLNIVIPPGALIELSPIERRWSCAVTTGVDVVDDLLRLRAAGRLQEVAAILAPLGGQDVIDLFEEYPAGAMVIGYGLLRTATIRTLIAPCNQLVEKHSDRPDVLIIAAEAFAREGDHATAATHFVAAARYGLPTFGFGVNYLMDRLRAYGPRPGGPRLSSAMIEEIDVALDTIQPFALCVDHDMLLTSYRGRSVARPEFTSDSEATQVMSA